jgi:YesN/AraC family two-component response regulator
VEQVKDAAFPSAFPLLKGRRRMNEFFRVLAADDEYWIRENLRNVLDWEAHSFVFLDPAENGEQALERIRAQAPDIVITDVNMPFISGTELIEIVNEENPRVVFIALSGYSDYEFVRSALVAGAIDYLLKPVSKGDLLAALNKAVDRIVKNRLEYQERQETQEKLMIAAGAAMDRELSGLIRQTGDKEAQEQAHRRLAEYELDFAGFTMAVFHTAMLSKILRKRRDIPFEKLIMEIKNAIKSIAAGGKSLVFHHTFKANEYILVTDMNRLKLEALCPNLTRAIGEITGFRVIAAVSRHHVAFSELRNAYNEAALAILSQPYRSRETVFFAGKTADLIVPKTVTAEQEKQLRFAVENGNRVLFQKILFEEIGFFERMEGDWSYAEVRQTAEDISRLMRGLHSPGAVQIPALDNLAELLLAAVDGFDSEEIRSVTEQMMEESFYVTPGENQSEPVRQTVMKVKKYIDNNYFEDLWLSGLAEQFAVESSYLSKTFKHITGDNLMFYIANIRVEKAKELLKKNKLNITDIALLVGYDDYSYFSRVFKKIAGLSPREYREKYENENT